MFVIVVVLVAAGAAAVPLLDVGGGSDDPAEYAEYSTSNLVPERSSAGGIPSVERADDPGLVLIDRAHANRFREEDIQVLVSAITAAGYEVEFLRPTEDFDAALSRADAFLVVDPALRYTESDVDRVESFVDSGGRLVMLGEPTQAAINAAGPLPTLSTARNRLATLSTRFGIEFGTGYLYNMETREGNFRNVFADPAGGGAVTDGIDRAVFYTATRVQVTDGSAALVAIDGTRNVRGDALGDYPVAVRAGNVVAIGDTTFLERDNYNVLDNDRLIGNLARFLTSGSRSRTIANYPATVAESPTIAYTSVGFLDAAQTVADDLRATGRTPTLSLRRGAGAGSGTDVLIASYDYLETHDVGAGITARAGRVAVRGYESNTDGVIVFRAPADGIDLVVAVDGQEQAERAAEILASGELDGFVIGDRTAVARTDAAVVQRFDGEDEDENGDGIGDGNGDGNETSTNGSA